MFDKTSIRLASNTLFVMLISSCYLSIAALNSSSYLIAVCFVIVGLSYMGLGYLNFNRYALLAILLVDSIVLTSVIGLAFLGNWIAHPAYVAAASSVIMAPPFVGIGLLVKYISSYNRETR